MTLLTELMGTWLWRATWQSAVLIGLVLVVQRMFRRQLEPRWRHALWFVVMLRLAMPAAPNTWRARPCTSDETSIRAIKCGICGFSRKHSIATDETPSQHGRNGGPIELEAMEFGR